MVQSNITRLEFVRTFCLVLGLGHRVEVARLAPRFLALPGEPRSVSRFGMEKLQLVSTDLDASWRELLQGSRSLVGTDLDSRRWELLDVSRSLVGVRLSIAMVSSLSLHPLLEL